LTGKPVQLNTTPTTSLSTGSLGKSQLASPNNVASNPIINNKAVVNNGGDISIKGDTLRPSFSLQNNTKVSESAIQVKADTVIQNTSVMSKPSQLAVSVADGGPRLTLLSAIFQAMGSHNTTPNSVSVLTTSPSAVGLPSVLPAFLESVLTSQQAMILAQALNKSISVEQLRASGQFDVLVLQGLLKEVESLHARVQLNQFSMLKDPDSPGAPTASWLIDLPIKDKQAIDFIQLQIDQFKDQDDDKEDDIWSVQLRLDTQNLGPLQATVTMQAEDIKIVLRAERPESALLLDNNIEWLHDALAKLGVSVSHVSCSCGPVAKPTLAEQYLAETSNLVDVSV
jgi:flagellar hook-length control protein FliK